MRLALRAFVFDLRERLADLRRVGRVGVLHRDRDHVRHVVPGLRVLLGRDVVAFLVVGDELLRLRGLDGRDEAARADDSVRLGLGQLQELRVEGSARGIHDRDLFLKSHLVELAHDARQVDGLAEHAERVRGRRLELRDDGIIVGFALLEVLGVDDFAAQVLDLLAERVDGTPAVVRVYADERPLVQLLFGDGPLGEGFRDHLGTVASAERPDVPKLRNLRREGDRGDERRLGAFRDVHHRKRAGASEVADDGDDLLHSDEFFHRRDRSGRNARRILDEEFDLVSADASCRVDLVDRHLDAVERQPSVIRQRSRCRHDHADAHVPVRQGGPRRTAEGQHRRHAQNRPKNALSSHFPVTSVEFVRVIRPDRIFEPCRFSEAPTPCRRAPRAPFRGRTRCPPARAP